MQSEGAWLQLQVAGGKEVPQIKSFANLVLAAKVLSEWVHPVFNCAWNWDKNYYDQICKNHKKDECATQLQRRQVILRPSASEN